MSSYLMTLSNLLCEKELIYPDSKSYLDHASTKLFKLGSSKSWEYTIEASEPINFVPAPDKKLEEIEVLVYLDVAVAPPKRDDLPPFERLNTKIDIFDLAKETAEFKAPLCQSKKKRRSSKRRFVSQR